MIRDDDGALTGYVYIDLNTRDYGGFVTRASNLLKQLALPPGFTYKWSGAYEFELRAKERLQLILPMVFFVIFVLLYMAFTPSPKSGAGLRHEDIEAAVLEGAVQRLRPKLMTVSVVLASLIPILWETGAGSDVMKPIAAPIVGGMVTSTIHVLILVPVFFALMKERALRRGTLQPREPYSGRD